MLIADGLHFISALKKAYERSQEEKAQGVSVTYDPRLISVPRLCKHRKRAGQHLQVQACACINPIESIEQTRPGKKASM